MKRSRTRRQKTSEERLIGAFGALFADSAAERVASIGIGDDAAVLRPVRGRPVWTVDTSVEGVHFDRRWLSASDIGARSFHAAASDLAAMGATPIAALSSLIVPEELGEREILSIARGQAGAASELRCPIAGGNVSRGTELSVTTTVIGKVGTPLTRGGARVGDEIWLLGDVGLAGAGLLCLRKGPAAARKHDASTRRAIGVCVAAWRAPRAMVREGRLLGRLAHAAIDVSDGLGTDLAHVSRQSGVRLVVEEVGLRTALRGELLRVSDLLRVDAVALAFSGGEDYALVATGIGRRRPRGARRIGRVEAGGGVRYETAAGRLIRPTAGFDHFSGRG